MTRQEKEQRRKEVLKCICKLPKNMIQLHGIDNLTEFLLYHLADSNCFNFSNHIVAPSVHFGRPSDGGLSGRTVGSSEMDIPRQANVNVFTYKSTVGDVRPQSDINLTHRTEDVIMN